MELALIIYLVFTALPAIATLTGATFAIWVTSSGFGMFCATISYGGGSDGEFFEWVWRNIVKKWAKVAIPCLIVSVLIPNKEVTSYMIGAYGVQTIAQNEQVQELAGDGLDVLQSLMKKAKAELEVPVEG